MRPHTRLARGGWPQVRLAAQFAAFALAVLALTAFVGYLVVRQQEERLIYRLAEQAADRAQQAGSAPPPDPLGRAAEFAPGHHLVQGQGEIVHVVVRDTEQGRLVVTYGDRAHRERLGAFGRIWLAITGVIAVVVLVLAGAWARTMVARRPALHRRLLPRLERAVRNRQTASEREAQLAANYGSYSSRALGSERREREFIANVGHELRTPITLILTGCELLLDAPTLDERQRAQLRRIMNAAKHMNDSVRSFLVLARDGDLGQQEVVDLRGCVLEAFQPHRELLAQRGIELRIHVGAEATVTASREALQVVVGNLVQNAVKYTERGGITVHHLGDTLYISDTGCGIASADLARVFEPFYRARAAAESGRAGLGLGLSIVKRICDFYGWTIELRSTVNVGTTVRVDFRRAQSLFG